MENPKGKANEEMPTVALANKLGRKLEIVIICLLTFSYISQGVKNSFKPWMIILLMASLWIPVILAWYLYRKDKCSPYIKHCIGIGYGIFFILVCFTSKNQLVFTYAFPMLIVVGIYCDLKFSRLVASIVIAISVIHAAHCAYTDGFSAEAIASMEIEICASVLVSVYTVSANHFIIRMNDRNMKKIEEHKNRSDSLLSNVMNVSNSLVGQVSDISEKMNELSASSRDTYTAMEEVQQGTTTTAQSVQTQLAKTEEIQKQINNVSSVSGSISDSVAESVAAIDEGKINVDNLIAQVESSAAAGNEVVSEVGELKDFTAQMESIVSLIQGIASKTSLLSLNASIEAARAGEAGRGFAVVATEISNLAAQTKTATEQISGLIGNVTNKMDTVATDVTSLVDSNKIQNEAAHVTAESFAKIADNTKNISGNSTELSKIVNTLGAANKEIIESIQTVSAISEETAAHSSSVLDKTSHNEDVVKTSMGVVSGMTENAEKLGSLNK